jgi:hypothetical protein
MFYSCPFAEMDKIMGFTGLSVRWKSVFGTFHPAKALPLRIVDPFFRRRFLELPDGR